MGSNSPIAPGTKPTLAEAAQFALVAAAWLALFWDVFPMLLSQWGTDDFSYCFLVPLAAGYFVWNDRTRILDSRGGSALPGLLLLLVSGLFFFAGKLGALETLLYISMWLSLVAIALAYLGHRAFSALFFPALILAFIVPPPAFIERTLSFNLRLVSSSFAADMLNLLGIPVFVEGNILDIGTMKLQVVDACSGLRYLLPTLFLSLIVGHMLLKASATRATLFLASAPISIGLNAVRLVVTALLARYVSPKFVEGTMHDLQGWAIYLFTVAALVLTALLLRRLEPKRTGQAASVPEGAAGSGGTGRAPLRTTVGVCSVLLLLSLGTGVYAKEQVIAQWVPLESFPLEIGQWKGTREYLDQPTLEALWADDYHLATYTNADSGRQLYLLIPYYKTQTARHTAHAPTSCLLGSGWEIRNRTTLVPSPQSGRMFEVQQLVLGKGGERLLSNFWFQQRGRIIVSELANKWWLVADAFLRHRTDGALVRVELPLEPGESVETAQAKLDAFVSQVQMATDRHLPR